MAYISVFTDAERTSLLSLYCAQLGKDYTLDEFKNMLVDQALMGTKMSVATQKGMEAIGTSATLIAATDKITTSVKATKVTIE